jgi:folate-dependent phosphoribosylglycinamide formyltransferase PurN
MGRKINNKILLLASDGISTNILYNAISKDFEISHVVLENPISKVKFLKNRFKRVGFFRLIDQLLFIMLFNKILSMISKKRKLEIIDQNNLNVVPIVVNKVVRVKSANLNSSVELIKKLNPDIILVNGTRILSTKLLEATDAIIVNIHAGITPNYRGVHGAYWAFVNKEYHLAGVTLHYVDNGVDTGMVINQALISINKNDNFVTYPLLQLSQGIVLLKSFLNNVLHSPTLEKDILGNDESNQWYHPGFFEYFYYRILRGVK